MSKNINERKRSLAVSVAQVVVLAGCAAGTAAVLSSAVPAYGKCGLNPFDTRLEYLDGEAVGADDTGSLDDGGVGIRDNATYEQHSDTEAMLILVDSERVFLKVAP